MVSKKGVLMQVSGNTGVVLTRNGQFRKVRLIGEGPYEVGYEVEYQESLVTLSTVALVAAACLAVVVLRWSVLTSFRPGLLQGRVLAYVSVDINPSVQLGVDERHIVCSAEGLNEDGRALLAQVPTSGRKLHDAVLDLVSAAVKAGYMSHGQENAILIASVPGEGDSVPEPLLANISSIKRDVERELNSRSISAVVESVSGGSELRTKARELNISPGRMALALKALSEGAELSEDQVRRGLLGQIAGGIERLKGFKLGDSKPKQIDELLKQFEGKKLKFQSSSTPAAEQVGSESSDDRRGERENLGKEHVETHPAGGKPSNAKPSETKIKDSRASDSNGSHSQGQQRNDEGRKANGRGENSKR